MLHYIDKKYRPTKKDLICEFYVEPNKITLEEAAEQIAAESSIGTWTDISTMNPHIAKTLKPTVFYINKETKIVKIAYPQDLFEEGNMPQILSSIAGNIYGMKLLNSLRLVDIDFPPKLIRSFMGPKFGIAGIRKITRIKDRPLCGTIVKPKVGLTPAQHAQVAYDAWMGGLDIVKDDENLSNMTFNRFNERIKLTLEARNRAEKITKEKKIYMPNITAETDDMIQRAEYVKKLGGEYIMIDILTCGWAGLQTIRKCDFGMVIHAHRAGHAALTRNHSIGMSMLVIAKIARLIGVDQLHIGTVVGKMEGSAAEVTEIEHEITEQLVKKGKTHALEENWGKIKPILPVCSGGLHPGHVPELIKIMGKNIVCQFGGGCHGHPEGTQAGAVAIRQAIDAVMTQKNFKKYSETHKELGQAIGKWGMK